MPAQRRKQSVLPVQPRTYACLTSLTAVRSLEEQWEARGRASRAAGAPSAGRPRAALSAARPSREARPRSLCRAPSQQVRRPLPTHRVPRTERLWRCGVVCPLGGLSGAVCGYPGVPGWQEASLVGVLFVLVQLQEAVLDETEHGSVCVGQPKQDQNGHAGSLGQV